MACRIFVPWPEIEPVPPEEEAWSLNHWTTKEVPRTVLYLQKSCKDCSEDSHIPLPDFLYWTILYLSQLMNKYWYIIN